MKRKILPKLLSCIIIALLGFPNTALSQTPDYTNSANASFTGSNTYPFGTTGDRQNEQIILAGEFTSATPGMITSIYFKRAYTRTTSTTYNDMEVRIGQTSQTSFSGTAFVTGAMTGRKSNYTLAAGNINTWFEIDLTTPILYDPSKSVRINVQHNGYTGSTMAVRTASYCGTAGIRRIFGSYGNTSGRNSDCWGSEMGIDLAPILGTDVMAYSVPKPNIKCGQTNAPFSVVLYNIGQDSVFDLPITMEVTGTVAGSPYSQTFNTLYTDTIKSFKQKEVTFPNTLNTMNGADLSVKAYVTAANDTTNDNDTITSDIVIHGTPSAPTTTDVEVCGGQEIFLQASTASPNEQIIWTETSDGKNYIAEGSNASAGFLNPGAYTYYAHTGRGFDRVTSTNGGMFNFIVTTTYSTPNGGFFKVDADAQSIIIDSVGAYLYLTGYTDYEVYYKNDDYTGYTNNATAWTLVAKGSDNYTGGTAGLDYFRLDKPVIKVLYI